LNNVAGGDSTVGGSLVVGLFGVGDVFVDGAGSTVTAGGITLGHGNTCFQLQTPNQRSGGPKAISYQLDIIARQSEISSCGWAPDEPTACLRHP